MMSFKQFVLVFAVSILGASAAHAGAIKVASSYNFMYTAVEPTAEEYAAACTAAIDYLNNPPEGNYKGYNQICRNALGSGYKATDVIPAADCDPLYYNSDFGIWSGNLGMTVKCRKVN